MIPEFDRLTSQYPPDDGWEILVGEGLFPTLLYVYKESSKGTGHRAITHSIGIVKVNNTYEFRKGDQTIETKDFNTIEKEFNNGLLDDITADIQTDALIRNLYSVEGVGEGIVENIIDVYGPNPPPDPEKLAEVPYLSEEKADKVAEQL